MKIKERLAELFSPTTAKCVIPIKLLLRQTMDMPSLLPEIVRRADGIASGTCQIRVIVSRNGDLVGGTIDVLALALLGRETVSCEEITADRTTTLRMRFDEINDFVYRRKLICRYFHANPDASVLEVAKALSVSAGYVEQMRAKN